MMGKFKKNKQKKGKSSKKHGNNKIFTLNARSELKF